MSITHVVCVCSVLWPANHLDFSRLGLHKNIDKYLTEAKADQRRSADNPLKRHCLNQCRGLGAQHGHIQPPEWRHELPSLSDTPACAVVFSTFQTTQAFWPHLFSCGEQLLLQSVHWQEVSPNITGSAQIYALQDSHSIN